MRAGPSELPRRRVRRGRVGSVRPGMRTAERLVHLGDGTAESRRRRRGVGEEEEEEEGTGGVDQRQQQRGRIQQRISGETLSVDLQRGHRERAGLAAPLACASLRA